MATSSDKFARLLHAGQSAGVRLVRLVSNLGDNRYTARQIEFDTNGTTTLVSNDEMTVTNLAEPSTTAGQLTADNEAVAIDVEGRWIIFVRQPGVATFPAKIVTSLGSAAYTVREQTLTGSNTFIDKDGTSNITAGNLAELNLGPGGAVDIDEIVMVTPIADNGTPPTVRYFFDHPAYAKYLD